ncbi:hypothetical protein N7478_002087 [Penicillium angulare]|uniref:uncharacterized protein n=1 Tax=Penicillium angulare TaxID=116970 RepID=UPI00253F6CEA|nr:uncharacterized protein N7478_002087 [Penicillium angulare]KAJ5289057.1 hypothetical protein N7478_002087 [Penicillium angulare]
MHFSIITIAISLAASAMAAPVPSNDEIVNVGDIVAIKRDPIPEENIDVLPGGVAVGGILKRDAIAEDDLLPGLVDLGPVHV